jgi:hypothetical protein
MKILKCYIKVLHVDNSYSLLSFQHGKYHIRLAVQYSIPEYEQKMFEACTRQAELGLNIHLKKCVLLFNIT